ncbi:MAG: hypothetical protein JXM70_16025 [Pirellulales bacterium]|nr:hypothetical protein [Pirellulales bacterium]
MTKPAQLHKYREQLAAMIRELQTNRIILDGLLNRYGIFRFTGGVVPTEPWGLVAMTSYLQRPFAAEHISTATAERYRHLVARIMDLGKALAAGERPRTLRCRYDIADRFGRDATEIQDLGDKLESAMTELVSGETDAISLSEGA